MGTAGPGAHPGSYKTSRRLIMNRDGTPTSWDREDEDRELAARTPPLEVDFCSWCHEHADFTLTDGQWRSVCCEALPIPVDYD